MALPTMERVVRPPEDLERAIIQLVNGYLVHFRVRLISAKTSHLGQIKAVFRNTSDVTIVLWWINFIGEEVHYGTLGPGVSFEQLTFINHGWIFREEGTGRRMSISNHEGQIFWPRVNREEVYIVAPPLLVWEECYHKFFSESFKSATRAFMLAHRHMEATDSWLPTSVFEWEAARNLDKSPAMEAAKNLDASPTLEAVRNVDAAPAVEAARHLDTPLPGGVPRGRNPSVARPSSGTSVADVESAGASVVSADAPHPDGVKRGGNSSAAGPSGDISAADYESAAASELLEEAALGGSEYRHHSLSCANHCTGSDRASRSGGEAVGALMGGGRGIRRTVPTVVKESLIRRMVVERNGQRQLDRIAAAELEAALSTVSDSEAAVRAFFAPVEGMAFPPSSRGAGASERTSHSVGDDADWAPTAGERMWRFTGGLFHVKRLRQMLAGGAESTPPAESPRWRLRELDPSTPGPPGSATLGCLPYCLVLHIISLAAPDTWQDAQQPMSAPDIQPFTLKYDPTGLCQAMVVASIQ